LAEGEHPYGIVPIARLIDTPIHRSPHIGQSRYIEVADLMRAYYNVDSESTLSNTQQAHPTLSGSKRFLEEGNMVPVGTSNVLPIDITPDGTVIPWTYVSPPKDPAESLEKKLRAIEDRKDRAACLAKPAGTVASSTTAQSGVSKQLDAVTGHKVLSSIAKSLKRAETTMALYATMVLRGSMPAPDVRTSIYIEYPNKFELFSADQLLDAGAKLQLFTGQAGDLPEVEGEILRQAARQLNPGLKDVEYAEMDAEIEAFVEKKSALREQMREQAPDAFGQQDEPIPPDEPPPTNPKGRPCQTK